MFRTGSGLFRTGVRFVWNWDPVSLGLGSDYFRTGVSLVQNWGQVSFRTGVRLVYLTGVRLV